MPVRTIRGNHANWDGRLPTSGVCSAADARCGLDVLLVLVGAAASGCADPGDPGELDAPTTATATAEIRVCADGPTVEGIDVSKWQGEIAWDDVAAAGVTFAFIRTNHGLDILDEWYDFNWSEARRVGVLRGTYQYFAPEEDPIEQAELLLERMGPLEVGDLPPVLDVEEAAIRN